MGYAKNEQEDLTDEQLKTLVDQVAHYEQIAFKMVEKLKQPEDSDAEE